MVAPAVMGTAWKNTAETFIKPTCSSSKMGYSVKPASSAPPSAVSSALESSALEVSSFCDCAVLVSALEAPASLLAQPLRAAVAVTAIAAAQMIAKIFFMFPLLLLK